MSENNKIYPSKYGYKLDNGAGEGGFNTNLNIHFMSKLFPDQTKILPPLVQAVYHNEDESNLVSYYGKPYTLKKGSVTLEAHFYMRLPIGQDLADIGMYGYIRDNWDDENNYIPDYAVVFDYPSGESITLSEEYTHYHYSWFNIPKDELISKPKAINVILWDVDPETSRGTETTVQETGGSSQ